MKRRIEDRLHATSVRCCRLTGPECVRRRQPAMRRGLQETCQRSGSGRRADERSDSSPAQPGGRRGPGARRVCVAALS
jgi:hypothetical protein